MAGANFSQKGLAARERTPTSHCPIVGDYLLDKPRLRE
jgi:hypothetical protein